MVGGKPRSTLSVTSSFQIAAAQQQTNRAPPGADPQTTYLVRNLRERAHTSHQQLHTARSWTPSVAITPVQIHRVVHPWEAERARATRSFEAKELILAHLSPVGRPIGLHRPSKPQGMRGQGRSNSPPTQRVFRPLVRQNRSRCPNHLRTY